MKQRVQYIILTIILSIILKLPQYRALAYLANESIESLQAKTDWIAELRNLVCFYEKRSFERSLFGITCLIPGHEEEMAAEVRASFMAQREFDKAQAEEEAIEVLLFYHSLKNAIER